MKKYITRFALIIPLVFTLLLAVVPFSSFAAVVDDIQTNYEDFDWSNYDFSNLEEYFSKDNMREVLGSTYNSNPYYFYMVGLRSRDLDNNGCLNLRSVYVPLSTSNIVNSGENFVVYNIGNNLRYVYPTISVSNPTSNPSFYNFSNTTLFGSSGSNYLWYFTDTGCFTVANSKDSSWGYETFTDIFYQESNLPDFPYAENVQTHVDNSLDVSVSFSPALSGIVDTSIVDHGVLSHSYYFDMHITNNSRSDIQYFMAIVDHDYQVFTGRQAVYNDYGDSVHYVFSTDEWVDRVIEYDMEGNSETAPARRRSEWHLLSSGATNVRNFSWSQMQLYKNKRYDVVVYAYPVASGSACVSTLHEYPLFDWSSCQEVYRSAFFMPADTTYNPNDTSFGNYPNKSGDSMDHGLYSAYVDDNGNTQYAPNGSYFSNDDLDNNRTSASYVYRTSSGSSVSSDIGTLSSNFSVFFQFLNRVFSYFPRSYQSIITCGLTAIIVLGVLKVVIR